MMRSNSPSWHDTDLSKKKTGVLHEEPCPEADPKKASSTTAMAMKSALYKATE